MSPIQYLPLPRRAIALLVCLLACLLVLCLLVDTLIASRHCKGSDGICWRLRRKNRNAKQLTTCPKVKALEYRKLYNENTALLKNVIDIDINPVPPSSVGG
jgi:hypothetical protein